MSNVTELPPEIDVYNLYELADAILKSAARVYRTNPAAILDIQLRVLEALCYLEPEALEDAE